MKITVSTAQAQHTLYPTPLPLAQRLLEGIHWQDVETVLEPSAGTGNLVYALTTIPELGRHNDCNPLDVDMIEIDPGVRGILADRFSEAAEQALRQRSEAMRDAYLQKARANEDVKEAEKAWRDASNQYYGFQRIHPKIVHDDFRTFSSRKKYDLIIMNPPFENGDAHLLKAIQMQERYGGQIRCILNAETVRNPYTNRRKVLADKLQTLHAEVTFEKGFFEDAERKSDVEIAVISVNLPVPCHESEIFSRMKAAQDIEDDGEASVKDLVENDFVKQIIKRYELECDLGCDLIREYNALAPYIQDSYQSEYAQPIIRLAVASDHASYGPPAVNDYIKAVRKKYWTVLFQHPKFVSQLTSQMADDLRGRVRDFCSYDFTEYNIRVLMAEVNAKILDGIQKAILELFETLTAKHAYYPECSGNIHYFNGWCSNKAHKIANKVVLPVNGIFAVHSWESAAFNVNTAYAKLSDMERVLNYLDGDMTAPVNLVWQLKLASQNGQTKNLHLKYFDISFYKKGTMHVRFTCPALLDRFNIYCARNKSWLPPCYGQKTYQQMDTEERAVVDAFHGDGSIGSGESAYTAVLENASYYLAPPNSETVSLPEGD